MPPTSAFSDIVQNNTPFAATPEGAGFLGLGTGLLSLFNPIAGEAASGVIDSITAAQENERQSALQAALLDQIQGVRGNLQQSSPIFGQDQISSMIRGTTPGAASQQAFQQGLQGFQFPNFNANALAGGIGQLGGRAQQQLGATRSDIGNVIGRAGGAVNQAFGEARDVLEGGRADDTLALGQRINQLSGLNTADRFTPNAALAQAASAARKQQQLINQSAGARPEAQAARQAALSDSAINFGSLGQQGAAQAQAQNTAVAQARAGILGQTGSLLEQLNAQRDQSQANLFGQQGAQLAALGGQEAGLAGSLGQTGAQLTQALANPLLQLGQLGLQNDQFNANLQGGFLNQLSGLAGQAALDPARQIELALQSEQARQGIELNPELSLLGLEANVLGGSGTPNLPLFSGFGQGLNQSLQQRQQRNANEGLFG